MDPVRALQHTLYRTAKADSGRRFHALQDKVYRRDVLERAWVAVRRNSGAPGIDATTLADVEQYGVARLLDELATELREGSYRPSPARRVSIPKPGSAERRPLSIPTVRDRVAQAATKIVLEPIFEADFAPCSFGFRPRRSPHDALMHAIEERVSDRAVLRLLRAMLRAGVMEDGTVRRPVTGAAQGGVISPLLCNVYLHRIDRSWSTRQHGVLVRFADDLLVMCRSREQAEAALQRLRQLLADLGLAPKEAKTRIVHLQVGEEGFDFLGFHHRLVRSRPRDGRRPVDFLARWPADKAMRHARDRIRELTASRRLLLDVETVVQDINAFLRGWVGYFKYGHSAQRFSKIRHYVRMRIALFIGKRHRRSRHFGRWALLHFTPNEFGLIGLYGIVVSPRAGKPWRDKPNAAGERRR